MNTINTANTSGATEPDIMTEMARGIPDNIPSRFTKGGKPMFTAFDCAVLEYSTGKSFIYRGVNMKTGKAETLLRRPSPLEYKHVAAVLNKLQSSPIAGARRLEVDKPFNCQDPTTFAKLREIQDEVFRDILPKFGYAIREKQVELAEHILEAVTRRVVTLAEAEVGTGKTFAYLLAAVLAKRGRVNDFWNYDFYKTKRFIDGANMPVVVSTSSIALQQAVINDYIPELSRILMSHGVIKTPLTAVIRKGKEHYVCERNLRLHMSTESNRGRRAMLEKLTLPAAPIDMADIQGLDAQTKHKICVPGRCAHACKYRESCRYRAFMKKAQSPLTDIQVCNHNYLLADTKRRAKDEPPLIPNFQSLVIDEAHKFLDASRSMYGHEFSNVTLPRIYDDVYEIQYHKKADAQNEARNLAKKLAEYSNRLFTQFVDSVTESSDPEDDGANDEAERFCVDLSDDALHRLYLIGKMAQDLIDSLKANPLESNFGEKQKHIIWALKQVIEQIAALRERDGLIYWLAKEDEGMVTGMSALPEEWRLCAIPKDLDKRLYDDLWSRGVPVVLTSGTLSAGGDFSHTKEVLGLNRLTRITETTKPSPFDYEKHSMLYVSPNMPFPNNKDPRYISAITDETERLINVAHGHTAVLFTSYKVMGLVYAELSKRKMPYPFFKPERKNTNAIDKFKNSGNGVLFAAGALWEGIDIPGDALTLLIIVKLPFKVPDPIGEYERAQYPGFSRYRDCVLTPEMAIKLKQGDGRDIRTEDDTGAVALLDCRAALGGSCYEVVEAALPKRPRTDKISDLDRFFRSVKPPSFYLECKN